MILLLAALGCRAPIDPSSWAPARAAPGLDRPVEVRYRPGVPDDADGDWLVVQVPRGQWDRGLASAAANLLSQATDRRAALDPASTASAAAAAGFPGQARFARALTGGARPDGLLRDLRSALPERAAVDLGMAVRRYGDGTALWIVGIAPHLLDMDPIPRDLALDEALALRVDAAEGSRGDPVLYLAPPDGPVETLSLTSGVSRWVDRFSSGGEYRLGVALERGAILDVALVFSVFVDGASPSPVRLFPPSDAPADPVAAEGWLYGELNALRAQHGLKPVSRFPLMEPVAREHSALMASAGRVAHVLPGLTEGVAERAADELHPRAEHHEAVAAAASAQDAMALIRGSPAHLRQVLCEACTGAAIGVALEPTLEHVPRLFFTLELLRFPNGVPAPIDHYNR